MAQATFNLPDAKTAIASQAAAHARSHWTTFNLLDAKTAIARGFWRICRGLDKTFNLPDAKTAIARAILCWIRDKFFQLSICPMLKRRSQEDRPKHMPIKSSRPSFGKPRIETLFQEEPGQFPHIKKSYKGY